MVGNFRRAIRTFGVVVGALLIAALWVALSFGNFRYLRSVYEKHHRACLRLAAVRSFIAAPPAPADLPRWIADSLERGEVRWVKTRANWQTVNEECGNLTEKSRGGLITYRATISFAIIPPDSSWAITAHYVSSRPRSFKPDELALYWPRLTVWEAIVDELHYQLGEATVALSSRTGETTMGVGDPARPVPIVGHVRGLSLDGTYPEEAPTLQFNPFRGGAPAVTKLQEAEAALRDATPTAGTWLVATGLAATWIVLTGVFVLVVRLYIRGGVRRAA